MATQHFFAEGRYLGSRCIPDNRIFPGMEIKYQDSYAKYCIRCGEIWARFVHDGARFTQLVQEPCRAHAVVGFGGTLGCHPAWEHLPYVFSDDWPPEAVAWEFATLLERAEKELSHAT